MRRSDGEKTHGGDSLLCGRSFFRLVTHVYFIFLKYQQEFVSPSWRLRWLFGSELRKRVAALAGIVPVQGPFFTSRPSSTAVY